MRSLHLPPASPTAVPRRGFSLIEVIIATAILLGSAVMLSRLAGLGRTYAQNTTQLAQAQRVCENTLNEIMMGLRPSFPVESAPVDPDEHPDEHPDESQAEILGSGRPQDRLVGANNNPRWLHSVRVRPEPRTQGLVNLTVEVMEARQSGQRRVKYSLTRWIRQGQHPTGRFSGEEELSFGGTNR